MFKKQAYISFEIIIKLSTLFALYQLVIYLHSKISYPFSLILFIVISFIISLPFFLGLRRSLLTRLFGILITKNSVTIQKDYKIKVNVEGTPSITSTRGLVFIENPKIGKHGELFDLFGLDKHIQINHIDWKSPDAIEIGRRRKGRNKVVIHWEPKEKINILSSPYNHTFHWTPLISYNDSGNYFEIYRDNPAGHINVSIETQKEIEYSVAFKNPKNFKNDIERYKHALNLKNPECPQPLTGGKKIEWAMDNPEIGAIYTICFFYKDGVAYWKQILNKKNGWLYQILK